jgi:tRNA dimethylallyltransferase
MSSIGYREMVEHVNGVIDLDTATSRIRRETRRLVRRQYTWFGLSDERIMWLDVRDPDAATDAAVQLIESAMR